MTQKDNFKYLILLITITPLILINIFTLKEGHNWGGDFAQYIIHALNILNGRPYTDGIMLKTPLVYPPGFPYLLAPVIQFTGVHFPSLKMLNIIFWFGMIFLITPYLTRRLGQQNGILSSIVLASSSFYFMFKQSVLSDIPFLFFIMWSFVLFERCESEFNGNEKRKGWIFFVLTLISISIALLLRSAGLMAFLALIFYCLLIQRKWMLSLMATGFLCATFILQTALIGGVAPGGLTNLVRDPYQTILVNISTFSIYFKSIIWFFLPKDGLATGWIYLIIESLAIILAPLLFLFISYRFVVRVKLRTISFMGCFFSFYLLMFFCWPNQHVFLSVRYALPLVIMVLIYSIEEIQRMLRRIQPLRSINDFKKVTSIGLILLISLNLGNIVTNFRFNDDVLFIKENQELFAWMRQNFGSNDHYLVRYPRPVALMTGKVGTDIWGIITVDGPVPHAEMHQKFKEWGVNVIILDKSVDQGTIETIKEQQMPVKLKWENNHYQIYLLNG